MITDGGRFDLQAVPYTGSELAAFETVAHGTHLQALAWAAGRTGPGAVLEVGSGWWSTPWLHGWCESTDRWLLTIETEWPWVERMRELYMARWHEIRHLDRGVIDLSGERFALALIDGINEERAGWLDRLADSETLVVVHDTEPGREQEMPFVAEALRRFEHRRDFTALLPHTAVVWNGGP